jgi:hypothetical protein
MCSLLDSACKPQRLIYMILFVCVCRLGDGFEFRIGEGGEGLMARGTLPKGTQRKYVRL